MPQTYRFGEFELDLDAHELRKDGTAVRLERRPFDLLVMLVQHHGRLVPRDDIIAALWPPNVIIDFDSGLNTLVRKVRNVLDDSPEEPRFITTVPGRGYRFVATVTEPAPARPVAQQVTARRSLPWLPTLVVLALVAGVGMFTWRSIGHEPQQTRIAILPFENLTGDEEFSYLASGIAEETNLSLAQIDLPGLSVIGIVSTAAIAQSGKSLPAIGEELNVDYVVMSSLRRDQSLVRITSRLLRVADGEQIWSASFDRELTNILGLQRELSVAIAEQIRQRLSPDVRAAIDRRQTQNQDAYALYLKGRYEWTQFRPDSVQRALAYYRQAVGQDARYALAWAGIAHALATSVVTVEANRSDVMAAATEALDHAIELGPDLAETQLALGAYRYFLERDLAGAVAAARRSVGLDSNNAMAHMFLGLMLSEDGKHVEARAAMRRARELDPLFPLMFANSAYVALAAGDARDSLELATQAVAINPEFWVGYLHLGNAQLALDDYPGALESYTNAQKLSGDNSIKAASSRAFVLARLGHVDEAHDILDELYQLAASGQVSAYRIAVIHAALGENDMAFEWLDKSVSRSNATCGNIATDRMLDTLRADSRLEELLMRCGTSR